MRLPKWISTKKACINSKNNDGFSFKLLRSINILRNIRKSKIEHPEKNATFSIYIYSNIYELIK